PTGLFASPGMFSVALSWNPGREPDIRMYEVYMAQGEEWIKLGAFASPMALLEDLAADTEYQFAVKALDADGHGSLLSPPVKVRTLK
ncbi:MAG: fibronectin type III domain-containing protein, partial [Nitrospinota bacterium]|nr:fibronectin type III domain-containing protein [Nitrospinota bacterium]